MLSIYALLTSPLLLFVIVFTVVGMWGIGKLEGRDLDVGFFRATVSQLYTGLFVIALVRSGLGLHPPTHHTDSSRSHSSSGLRPSPQSCGSSELQEFLSSVTQHSWKKTSLLISQVRRSRWSAAYTSPYETGRPPGALSGSRRWYRKPQNWEFRDPRFEELDTEEDEVYGVRLDPNGYASRRQVSGAGDRLYFDGYDLGKDRRYRGGMYDDGAHDYISEGDEQYEQRSVSREREEILLRSALDRISRARMTGKTNVNLSIEEMAALERRRDQQPEPASTLASPPVTPIRSKDKEKVKGGSRSNSSTSLKAQSKQRKSSSSFFGSPAKSNSKAKVQREPQRKQSTGEAYSFGGTLPPAMIPGPNGMMYAPVGYYPPPSPDLSRRQTKDGGSRSSSKHRRRESTPPELQAYPRFYSGRPDTSGSSRSVPAEEYDWYSPHPVRPRSSSNAQYASAYDYDMPPPSMPAAQGRRNVSGPPAPGYASNTDPRYASLRRTPQSLSPLAQSSNAQMGSGLRRVETSSSDSSDGSGVRVDIVPDRHGGYSIRQSSPDAPSTPAVTTTATGTPTKGGSDSRKRKGGKR